MRMNVSNILNNNIGNRKVISNYNLKARMETYESKKEQFIKDGLITQEQFDNIEEIINNHLLDEDYGVEINTSYRHHNSYEKINGLVMYPNVFDILFINNGNKLPTLSQFVKESINELKRRLPTRSKGSYVDEYTNQTFYVFDVRYRNEQQEVEINFKDKAVQDGFLLRTKNAYISLVVEFLTEVILATVLDGHQILASDKYDYGLGVDLVIVGKDSNSEKYYTYVYVASDTKYSRNLIVKKGKIKGKYYKKGGGTYEIDRSVIPEKVKNIVHFTYYEDNPKYFKYKGMILPDLNAIKDILVGIKNKTNVKKYHGSELESIDKLG